MRIIHLDRVERAISLSLSLFLGLFLLACMIWGALGPDPHDLQIRQGNSSRCALEGSPADYTDCMNR